MPSPLFRPAGAPEGVLVAVSERGSAPAGAASPTEWLARRFAGELGLGDIPIVRASQVHGARVVKVAAAPSAGATVDAGECDALVTSLPGVALVVQTADCVPVLLAADGAIGAVHAGWRGVAAGVAGAAVKPFLALVDDRLSARAWLGPSIGACCYEVGPEVAHRFPGDFTRPAKDGRFLLDLAGVVRRQIENAGIPPGNVTAHAGCTRCGGERYASYRRDRETAGRMIAFVTRLDPRGGPT
ncbi:MAG: polyphenol oxidase family protein [Acidobacteriota bacterium]